MLEEGAGVEESRKTVSVCMRLSSLVRRAFATFPKQQNEQHKLDNNNNDNNRRVLRSVFQLKSGLMATFFRIDYALLFTVVTAVWYW